MAQSEATEKPVARARGGIASESAVSKPGPMIAKRRRDQAVRRRPRSQSVGARANSAEQPPPIRGRSAKRSWMSPLTSLPTKRFVAMREPMTSPTIANGSAMANGEAATAFAEAELLLVEQRAERREPDQAPSTRNGKLHQIRWSERTLCTVRQLSENDGASSSVLTISSEAPVACRSHRPRIGLTELQREQREDHGRDRRRRGTAPASRTSRRAGRR